MSSRLPAFTVAALLAGGTALADVPQVATDIAPVHSLVARVMDGVGSPALIIQSGASPHEYRLRPSEARALQDADLFFWIGDELTPWMADAVENLATNATVTSLLEVDGTIQLETRENALFEAHDHAEDDDHEGHGHDDHGHEDDEHADEAHKDHDAHDHKDHDAHEGHKDHETAEHDDHDGHDDHHAHEGADPHAWLSVENARIWLTVIAAQMSAIDPENSATYTANAEAARTELSELSREILAALSPVRTRNFIVFHDAYQYFETHFDIAASGAISISDASAPSPARIATIQNRVHDAGVHCVLAEPQFNSGLIKTVLAGTDANTGVIDHLGANLALGKTLYPDMIRGMANTLLTCLQDK